MYISDRLLVCVVSHQLTTMGGIMGARVWVLDVVFFQTELFDDSTILIHLLPTMFQNDSCEETVNYLKKKML